MQLSGVNFNNSSNVYVDSSVSKNFADNTISQYKRLLQNSSSDIQAKNLVILKSAENAQDIDGLDPETMKYFEGDGKIAYGIYAKNSDTIFIIEDNHQRKDEKYEGAIETQGADTLTHEFGHLLDKGVSSSKTFRKAYLEDLNNIFSMLQTTPDKKLAGSDMTVKESVEYFKHYMEGVDFSDGVSKKDVTKRGVRENFAESFSTIFDSSESKVNEIYSELFSNSIQAVKNVFIA